MDKKYIPSALVLYLNYFIHGIGCSILSQQVVKEMLASQWGLKDVMAVTSIAAALGLGRLISLPFAGPLSDKLGRRLSVIIGCASYVIFLVGIAFSPNTTIAYIAAVLGGIANSFLDTATYPAVTEIIYKYTGIATMGIKFFISVAQLLMPFFLGIVAGTSMSYLMLPVIAGVCIGIMGDDVGGQDCEKHPVKRFQWIVGHDHVHAVRGGKYDYSAHICLHIGLHLSYGRGQLRILVCDKQVVQGEEKVQVCGRDDYVAVAVNNAGNAVAVKAVGRDQCLHVGFVALSGQNAENASLVDDGNGIKDALVFQKGNAAFPCRGSLEARQAAEIMRGSIGADALPLYIAQNKLRKTKHLCSLL